MRLLRCLIFGLASGATACGGPTVGDILQNEVRLSVAGIATKPEVAAIGEPQEGLGVARAFLSASAVSLMPCSENVNGIVLLPRGYELLNDPPLSELVTTSVSQFCGVQIDIDPVAENATAGVPDGASLYIEGKDAAGMPLELSSDRSSSLLFEAAEGESFGELPLLLAFDLSTWLAGLPLAEDMADMQADLFESQLQDSAALYVDANGNQVLDDDEQTPVAQAAPPR
jgi:hypothetical protein